MKLLTFFAITLTFSQIAFGQTTTVAPTTQSIFDGLYERRNYVSSTGQQLFDADLTIHGMVGELKTYRRSQKVQNSCLGINTPVEVIKADSSTSKISLVLKGSAVLQGCPDETLHFSLQTIDGKVGLAPAIDTEKVATASGTPPLRIIFTKTNVIAK